MHLPGKKCWERPFFFAYWSLREQQLEDSRALAVGRHLQAHLNLVLPRCATSLQAEQPAHIFLPEEEVVFFPLDPAGRGRICSLPPGINLFEGPPNAR